MRISHIKIKNILGHEELELSPKGFTVISGGNGTGKTSVLEAIKAALGGTKRAEQAKLLRRGAEEGEVVLVLDDGLQIKRRLDNEGKNTISVYDPKTRGRFGQTFLDDKVDGLSINPVAFLLAKGKEQTDLMLEAIRMELPREEFDPIVKGFGLRAVPEKGHPLEIIDAAGKELTTQRRDLKRDMEDRRATANTLYESLPDEPAGSNWAEVVKSLEDERDQLSKQHTERERDAERAKFAAMSEDNEKFNAAVKKAQDARDERIVELKRQIEELQNQIQQAKDECDAVEKRCRGYKHEREKKVDEEYNARVAELRAEFNPKLEDVVKRITEARTKGEASIRANEVRRLIDEKRKEADQLEAAWDMRNVALEKLDALKRRLCTNLPIEGLEVNGGAISVNGIPFETLNTAKKVRVAFEIAALRARDLGVICCDGLECLDPETLEEFNKAAEDSGLQIIVTRVTEGPFQVTTK